MDESFSRKKNAKIESLADDIEASAEIGHDTENQLSNNLIAITLAFVALLAASVSTSDVLTTIDRGQEILMMASISIFAISIFVGLFNYYLNMLYHQRVMKMNRMKAQRATKADSQEDLKQLKPTSVSGYAEKIAKRNNLMIGLQILLLAIGLVLCVAFIGTMLFYTARVKS